MANEFIPVSLTPKAVEQVRYIMETKNIPKDYGLRIGIKGSGGCAGFTHMLGFDTKLENDLELNLDGIPIYVEKKHAMYLLGLTVDFHEGADAQGFTFTKTNQ